MTKFEKITLPILALLMLLWTACFVIQAAQAGTVVFSTTTWNGNDEPGAASGALPAAGAYVFDLVATATPAATSPLSGLAVYLQQVGVSGQVYTLNSSTFTTCNTPCVQLVNPDVYEGGNIKVRWSINAGSSATFKVTARQITP